MKESLRPDEIAKEWDCSPRTIRRLIQKGKLPSFRLRRAIRVRTDELERFRIENSNKAKQVEHLIPKIPREYGLECSKTKTELIDLMGEPEESFNQTRIDRLRGPIVYAWIRNGKCLYVGRSYNGIGRPFDRYHHRIGLNQSTPDDEILIWPVANKSACDRIEHDLIRKLQPAFNLRQSFLDEQENLSYR